MSSEMAVGRPTSHLIWDLPLRLFHWLLVLSLAASWATAKAGFDWRPTHMRLGYFTIGLLLFRIVWGFIGPRHARFASFLKGPVGVWRYARGMAAETMLVKSAGHNPLGALMVVLMLVLLAVQTGSGLFTSDDIVYAGPYNGAVSESLAKQLGHIHQVNFNIILAAVALHILAIGFYTFAKKQRLVPAMFTGRKPAGSVAEHEAISSSQIIKACIVALMCAGLVYWLVSAAPPPSAASSFN
jgi:cytochrome b